jgi:deoxyribodipyrimidine photo-lyase
MLSISEWSAASPGPGRSRGRYEILGCMATALAVFTRDLRLADNSVLTTAVAESSQVIPVFVVDDELLARYDGHASRLAFLTDSLRDLDAGLRARGGALIVRRGQWTPTLLSLAQAAGAATIHVADDYSHYARTRLAGLERAAEAERVQVVRHPGVTLVAPGTVAPAGRDCYQVFTPYYRRWLDANSGRPLPAPPAIRVPEDVAPGRVPDIAELTAEMPAPGRPAGGESAAMARLAGWIRGGLRGYGTSRNELADDDGSSRLSPYLHLGCISARTVRAGIGDGPGSDEFGRQLAWRDFFHQVLAARPDASWRDFRSRGDRWRDDEPALAAWAAGMTGYPVVDAGLRQLTAEAHLPNRARMIVASFLTKDLYVDWRHGAAVFMRLLADGDIACNQLNWQWVAGTGTDTSAHRVFNPAVQARRFDPSGTYIRRYVPELAALPAEVIHDPDPRTRRACGYPAPLVEHAAAVQEYRTRRARSR